MLYVRLQEDIINLPTAVRCSSPEDGGEGGVVHFYDAAGAIVASFKRPKVLMYGGTSAQLASGITAVDGVQIGRDGVEAGRDGVEAGRDGASD